MTPTEEIAAIKAALRQACEHIAGLTSVRTPCEERVFAAKQFAASVEPLLVSSETPEQPSAPAPKYVCATRIVGGDRPVCVYLHDGTKIVAKRGEGVTGPVWLEVQQQGRMRAASTAAPAPASEQEGGWWVPWSPERQDIRIGDQVRHYRNHREAGCVKLVGQGPWEPWVRFDVDVTLPGQLPNYWCFDVLDLWVPTVPGTPPAEGEGDVTPRPPR